MGGRTSGREGKTCFRGDAQIRLFGMFSINNEVSVRGSDFSPNSVNELCIYVN